MKHLHGLLTKTPKPRLLHWGLKSISWMSDWLLDSIINGLYACITQCFIIVSSADQNPFLRDMIMHWFRSITIKLCNHSKRKRTGLVLKRKMPIKTNIMVTVVGGSIQTKPRPYASLLLKYQQDSEWTLLQSQTDKIKMCALGHRWQICSEIWKWHKCWESHTLIPRINYNFLTSYRGLKVPTLHCTWTSLRDQTITDFHSQACKHTIKPSSSFPALLCQCQQSGRQCYSRTQTLILTQGSEQTPNPKYSTSVCNSSHTICATGMNHTSNHAAFWGEVCYYLDLWFSHCVQNNWVKNIP